MAQIHIQNLTFCYDGSYDNIFENLTLDLDTDWRLGLVGRNGKGKTTLLRLLCGELEYRGSITAPAGFSYFPFPLPAGADDLTGRAVAQAIDPDCAGWQLERELGLLQVDPAVLDRPFGTLSGGEQTRLLLGLLFCQDERFLLIDEPTNHLDSEARDAVCRYLGRKRGFLLVSHDRRFLDACVDHLLVLNKTGVELVQGGFSSWWAGKQARDAAELAENEQLRREIGRLTAAKRRTADWSDKVEKTKIGTHAGDRGFIGKKSAKMMQRAKNVERRLDRARTEKEGLLRDVEYHEELKLHPLTHRKDVLVEARGLSLSYGGRTVVSGLNFKLRNGECLVVRGRNGAGKSTLLRRILGDGIETGGTLELAGGLRISYVPQGFGHLSGPLDRFIAESGVDQTLCKAILRKLGFSRVQFEKPLERYSAGQKKKVLLARSLCESAHLYLWDEPLNYIDIFSRMQLEELLQKFQPTLLMVEHDAAFADAVADRVIEL